MKKAIYFLFFSLCCITLQAQESKIRNKTIFVEYGGHSSTFSLNYDMRFSKNSNKGLGFRAGIGYEKSGNATIKYDETRWVVPLEINYLLGADQHYWDFGLRLTPNFYNATFDTEKSKGTIFFTVPSIGYRFQGKKGLVAKINYAPNIRFIDLPSKPFSFSNRFGFAIGYSF